MGSGSAGATRAVTVEVAEEFHLVGLDTRHLVPGARDVLRRLPDGEFTSELQQSVVAARSAPHARLADLRDDLVRARRALADAAERSGLAVAAAGTVPLARVEEIPVTPDVRYLDMVDTYQRVAHEQLVCGTRVHVRVADRDLAVRALPWLAPWLPVLLAMSASSPYWLGGDTGYASWRSSVWRRWPTAGPAGSFASAAEYDAMVDGLLRSGVISDPGMVYSDVRPAHGAPALELRVTDACPHVDDALLVAGLFRALVVRACGHAARGDRPPAPPDAWLRAATWRAARSGLEDELVDPVRLDAAPAADVVRDLLDTLRADLADLGDWEHVSAAATALLSQGSSAARQRAAAARGGSLADAVDLVVAETRTRPSGPLGGTIPAQRAPGLFEAYTAPADEAVAPDGRVRPDYVGTIAALTRLGAARLRVRARARDETQRRQGTLFRPEGADEPRLFPYDLFPRIVRGDDWALLRGGLAQRVAALEAFLHDVHGERLVIRDRVVPPWVVDGAPGLRDTGARLPADTVRITLGATDLVRDGSGTDGWLVLEDNLRAPSGIAYALAARRLAAAALPEMLPGTRPGDRILTPDQVPSLLKSALVAAAPRRSERDPAVALLSDGPDSPAWYEHKLLADEMAVPLVTPSDLRIVDGRVVAMGGRYGAYPVDVLYRRIDEDRLLAATGADRRPLGPPLLDAVRSGTVAIANALGNGVADDKVLYAFVPSLIEYYLGERPLLRSVPTYLCGDPDDRAYVLDHLGELVVKPVDGHGGTGVVIGPDATEAELKQARVEITAAPRRWVAQETVTLSTHPTFTGERFEPRAVDLRTFVCHSSGGPAVLPVALTRSAPSRSLLVHALRGGGAKDTWIMR
ncbi:carboxylate--amine ligase/circularly permuted type 2 ATP-grasp protein [Yinghuangia sp. ASG 101]|uniref:carboxylate--amine ligase/circularly permuted type 2 ATP-grasp protein n=1 Tax=Yinghuangia sp. ASG 101 TaxID=2896848 RepID=UPI001E423E38|nr:carboxylate--amine ligase/circularly permuted type 2 ATP-grasp protein [Yinghuangia sp. ASG 101]UGQ13669.1 carboxylate--amine ligase/circularly permuted type 2 ATP-grasp protein [Yinghuangia sp. ASG 101]